MSRTLQWVIGIGVVLLVAAYLFATLASLFLPRPSMAGFPMLHWPAHMFGPGHMFGMPGWGFPLFAMLGLTRLVWPLLVVGLVVWAIATLVRPRPQPPFAAVPPAPPAPAGLPACSQCGQPLQPGWRHCPNCGQPVAG